MRRSMSSSPPSRGLLAALAAAAIVALGGCGGSGTVIDRDGELHLTLDEYRIVPDQIEVRAGRVHIVARDVGVLTHNVVVKSYADTEDANQAVYGRTATAHPGQTVTATVTLKPGKYRLACTISNHENLGQFGTLYVR
jgi:uncharacterized cupredoxin-like copper-binding protein